MRRDILQQQIETYRKKIQILEHALSASAGAYYNINITRNCIPGTMYQVIDDVEYSINEAIGFPEDCCYRDVIEYWGNQLADEYKPAYFAFFDLSHLIRCFESGEDHIFHRYWTKDSLGNPMLAEQHVVMYRDLATDDLMAVTYVFDHTKLNELHSLEAEQKRLHEEDIRKIEGLASQYSALYYINFDTRECTKYRVRETEAGDGVGLTDRWAESFFARFEAAVRSCSAICARDSSQ